MIESCVCHDLEILGMDTILERMERIHLSLKVKCVDKILERMERVWRGSLLTLTFQFRTIIDSVSVCFQGGEDGEDGEGVFQVLI